MYFPVSGVQVSPLVPLGVAFVVSFFTSMGSVSGAFLLLPFQISVLHFTSYQWCPRYLWIQIPSLPDCPSGRQAFPCVEVEIDFGQN